MKLAYKTQLAVSKIRNKCRLGGKQETSVSCMMSCTAVCDDERKTTMGHSVLCYAAVVRNSTYSDIVGTVIYLDSVELNALGYSVDCYLLGSRQRHSYRTWQRCLYFILFLPIPSILSCTYTVSTLLYLLRLAYIDVQPRSVTQKASSPGGNPPTYLLRSVHAFVFNARRFQQSSFPRRQLSRILCTHMGTGIPGKTTTTRYS